MRVQFRGSACDNRGKDFDNLLRRSTSHTCMRKSSSILQIFGITLLLDDSIEKNPVRNSIVSLFKLLLLELNDSLQEIGRQLSCICHCP